MQIRIVFNKDEEKIYIYPVDFKRYPNRSVVMYVKNLNEGKIAKKEEKNSSDKINKSLLEKYNVEHKTIIFGFGNHGLSRADFLVGCPDASKFDKKLTSWLAECDKFFKSI